MIPTRPSRTAETVAFMRATERARSAPMRILDDPYAASFLGPLPKATLAAGRAAGRLLPMLTTYIVARHRYIDDALLAALASGVEQVVVLGAGYDSRAWRFADALAGRPLFEVDYPATQARKVRLVEGLALPPVDVRRVPVDFQRDQLGDVLEPAGFRVGRPTFFIWEGVSMYLRRASVKATLSALHALGGPGSSLAMDLWFLLDDPGLLGSAHRAGPSLLSLLGEPVTFGLHPEDVGPFAERLGWRVTDLADADALAARYVRDGRAVYPADYVLVAERIA